ncbi:hypothetical protein ACLOJK_011477 [Asimina triloba]
MNEESKKTEFPSPKAERDHADGIVNYAARWADGVKNLRYRCEYQDVELHKSELKAKTVAVIVAESSSRRTAAREMLKSLADQLNDLSEKVSPEVYDFENIKSIPYQLEELLQVSEKMATESSSILDSTSDRPLSTNERTDDGGRITDSQPNPDGRSSLADTKENMVNQNMENESRSPVTSVNCSNEGEAQVVEQFEPGVYVTLLQRQNGAKMFKRVKFSKRRFGEHQAEEWWRENKEKVYKKYNYRGADEISAGRADCASSRLSICTNADNGNHGASTSADNATTEALASSENATTEALVSAQNATTAQHHANRSLLIITDNDNDASEVGENETFESPMSQDHEDVDRSSYLS